MTQYFHYDKNNEEFIGFANWISEKLQTKIFLDKANKFIEIEQRLKTEPVGQKRTELVNDLCKLKKDS